MTNKRTETIRIYVATAMSGGPYAHDQRTSFPEAITVDGMEGTAQGVHVFRPGQIIPATLIEDWPDKVEHFLEIGSLKFYDVPLTRTVKQQKEATK